jgi:uncharacterized protein (DUF58 family)
MAAPPDNRLSAPIAEARALAKALPALMMQARQAASAVAGNHGRRRPGTGDAFWQYRPAQAGDALGQIDWRQSAKGDLLHVKETEALAAHHAHVWCDLSASMAWRSQPGLPFKQDRALLLTLGLGCLLLQSGERVAVLGSSAPTLSGHHSLERLGHRLVEGGVLGDGGMPPLPVRPRRRQAVIVVSDFWHPPETWENWIRTVAGFGLRGHLVQVTDGAEETLPFAGRVRLAGLEGEPPMLAERIEDLAQAFGARVAAHRERLRAITDSVGWSFLTHRTDHPPAPALLALFTRLQDRPQWR